MDQIIIGKFIASERKRKGYTQRQLADLLQISDKTISKWERGNGFPEVSLLLPLCRELDITVNELLSGERVSEEDYQKDYQQKAEENMVTLIKEKEYVQTYNPLIWWIAYGPDFETAKSVREILDACFASYLMSDSSKLGTVTFAQIAELSYVNGLIIDSDIEKEDYSALAAVTDVILAE